MKRRMIVTVMLIIVVMILLGLFLLQYQIQNAPIAKGTPGGDIAFMSNRDGVWGIYSLNTKGDLRALTDTEGSEYFPSWSLDGKMLNFLTNRSGEIGPGQVTAEGQDFRTLDIVSAVITLIGEQRFDWDADWAIDGTMLWASIRDLNLELYMLPAGAEFEMSNAIRITENGGRDWFANWAYDTSKIVFSSDREGNENIYLYNLDTAELTQLTDADEDELYPVFSLDGQEILYVSDANNLLLRDRFQLHYMHADGTQTTPFDDHPFEGGAHVAPDGQSMVYFSNQSGHWHIYQKDLQTGTITQLTEGEADYLFPVWRP